MSGIFVENAILADAIKELQAQYEKLYGRWDGRFYLGTSGILFLQVVEQSGKTRYTADLTPPGYHGKLTVARQGSDCVWRADPRIVPVDCYNLIQKGEDIHTAVERLRVDAVAERLLKDCSTSE